MSSMNNNLWRPRSQKQQPPPSIFFIPVSLLHLSMATTWFKSLQCKSTAFHDLIPTSCSNSLSLHHDVTPLPTKKPKPRNLQKPEPEPEPTIFPFQYPPTTSPFPVGPTLTELRPGHSSHCVVEIIFKSSWAAGPNEPAFPGRIEMLFRVHNPTRTVARFEDYCSSIIQRTRASHVRCAVDGNEMMRFHSAASNGEQIYDTKVKAEKAGIRTFEGSGGAHESVSGLSGSGRRAILVSRVIAGRVRCGSNPETVGAGYSVAVGRGELVVFDSRAVLPRFLIVYKI